MPDSSPQIKSDSSTLVRSDAPIQRVCALGREPARDLQVAPKDGKVILHVTYSPSEEFPTAKAFQQAMTERGCTVPHAFIDALSPMATADMPEHGVWELAPEDVLNSPSGALLDYVVIYHDATWKSEEDTLVKKCRSLEEAHEAFALTLDDGRSVPWVDVSIWLGSQRIWSAIYDPGDDGTPGIEVLSSSLHETLEANERARSSRTSDSNKTRQPAAVARVTSVSRIECEGVNPSRRSFAFTENDERFEVLEPRYDVVLESTSGRTENISIAFACNAGYQGDPEDPVAALYYEAHDLVENLKPGTHIRSADVDQIRALADLHPVQTRADAAMRHEEFDHSPTVEDAIRVLNAKPLTNDRLYAFPAGLHADGRTFRYGIVDKMALLAVAGRLRRDPQTGTPEIPSDVSIKQLVPEAQWQIPGWTPEWEAGMRAMFDPSYEAKRARTPNLSSLTNGELLDEYVARRSVPGTPTRFASAEGLFEEVDRRTSLSWLDHDKTVAKMQRLVVAEVLDWYVAEADSPKLIETMAAFMWQSHHRPDRIAPRMAFEFSTLEEPRQAAWRDVAKKALRKLGIQNAMIMAFGREPDDDQHQRWFDFGDGPVTAYRHANGGGWCAITATVGANAYVGRNACVYNRASVVNEARVEGFSQVHGDAQVQDYTVVRDHANVSGYTSIRNSAIIEHDAKVSGWTQVYLMAKLGEGERLLVDQVANNDDFGPFYVDFRDESGPVLAHRHSNGGGWVAETSSVHESAFVALGAGVGPRSEVEAGAKLNAGARVLGSAAVRACAVLDERSIVSRYCSVNEASKIGQDTKLQEGVSIHRRATIGARCVIGATTTIGEACVVWNDVRIGSRAIVETRAMIGDGAEIGDEAMIGAGAKIVQNARVPRDAKVASGERISPGQIKAVNERSTKHEGADSRAAR